MDVRLTSHDVASPSMQNQELDCTLAGVAPRWCGEHTLVMLVAGHELNRAAFLEPRHDQTDHRLRITHRGHPAPSTAARHAAPPTAV